jgi:folate-binding protein YgfZ
MVAVTPAAARRPRAYVAVRGPQAVEYLDRMLSNDVPVSGSADALLLTPKARVIAPLLVWRRGPDDVLLLTEPELGEVVRAHLVRNRFAARCDVALEEHFSVVVFATDVEDGIENRDYGEPAFELVDVELDPTVGDEELERRRIAAATPRFGRELDDRVLPAEAGLDERAISFTKGCYPGQEPIARQHYRGKVNRRLRVLDVDGASPEAGTPVTLEGKDVGRVTSAVPGLALAYVRVEVPEDAVLQVGAAGARLHLVAPSRP